MQFDRSSFALGTITSAGVILCLIFALELDIFVDTPLCAGDENGLTCARNWANAFAIIAAALTIIFLAREQSFAREVAILQTLDLRMQLGRARRNNRSLQFLAKTLRRSADRWQRSIERQTPQIKPRFTVNNLLTAERLLRSEDLRSLSDMDGKLFDRVEGVLFSLEDLLRTFLPEDLSYVRTERTLLTEAMISRDWAEDIEPAQLVEIAKSLEEIANGFNSLSEHLSDFRGSAWFGR